MTVSWIPPSQARKGCKSTVKPDICFFTSKEICTC